MLIGVWCCCGAENSEIVWAQEKQKLWRKQAAASDASEAAIQIAPSPAGPADAARQRQAETDAAAAVIELAPDKGTLDHEHSDFSSCHDAAASVSMSSAPQTKCNSAAGEPAADVCMDEKGDTEQSSAQQQAGDSREVPASLAAARGLSLLNVAQESCGIPNGAATPRYGLSTSAALPAQPERPSSTAEFDNPLYACTPTADGASARDSPDAAPASSALAEGESLHILLCLLGRNPRRLVTEEEIVGIIDPEMDAQVMSWRSSMVTALHSRGG